MFEKTLAPGTRRVLILFNNTKIVKNFYLAGGTALALQFGHRQSIDLDFFSYKKFKVDSIKRELQKIGKVKIKSQDEDTLHVDLDSVAVSFLYYPYKLLYKKKKYENAYLADWRDIACMKLTAVSGRGSKKDFIDLYFILKQISFELLVKTFSRKYRGFDYNLPHILKSLIYFEDAEKEPLPRMVEKVSWKEIREELTKLTKKKI